MLELQPREASYKTAKLLSSLALTTSVIVFGLSAVFVKWSEEELSPLSAIFNSFWLTALILGLGKLGMRFSGDRAENTSRYSARQWLKILAVGIFVAAELILWGWSLTRTSIANGTLLANLTPIFTSVAAWLLWRRGFDPQFILGMSVALVGSSSLGWGDGQSEFKISGDVAGVLAAIAHSVTLLILEDLESEVKSGDIVFWSSVLIGSLLFPLAWLSESSLSATLPHSLQGWVGVLGIALGCQVIGLTLLSYCFQEFSAGFIAVVLLLDPILSAIAGWLVFGETLGLLNIIAFVLVLWGIYLASTSASARNHHLPPEKEIS